MRISRTLFVSAAIASAVAFSAPAAGALGITALAPAQATVVHGDDSDDHGSDRGSKGDDDHGSDRGGDRGGDR
ncbi:hypothetical protein, partial [Streptomyces sp. NPDC018056]